MGGIMANEGYRYSSTSIDEIKAQASMFKPTVPVGY